MSHSYRTPHINLIFLLLISFHLSCSKEENTIDLDIIDLETDELLGTMTAGEDGRIYVAGGSVWDYGVMIRSDGEKTSWQVDSFSNKRIFDVEARNGLVAVGTDGYFYEKDLLSDKWTFYRLAHWGILRSVKKVSSGFLAVGGKAFDSGYIYHIDPTYQIDHLEEISNELADIAWVSGTKYIATGFGVVMKTEDDGYTWKRLSYEGDFFKSVFFIDDQKGFIVGNSGTIMKSTDGGNTWEKQKDGNHLFNGNPGFNKVYFSDANNGYIIGEKGLLWMSGDGGDTWTSYKTNTEEDLLDILHVDGDIYISGNGGFLARFEK